MKTINLITVFNDYDGIVPEDIRQFLPEKPAAVVCGIGNKHLMTAKKFGLKISKHNLICGNDESLAHRWNKEVVIFETEKIIPLDELMLPAAQELIENSDDGSVLIIGELFWHSLALEDGFQAGQIIKVEFDNRDGIVKFDEASISFRQVA